MPCANADGLEMADVEIGLKENKDMANSDSLKGDMVGQLKSTAEAIVADCFMSVQNQTNIGDKNIVTDGMDITEVNHSDGSVEKPCVNDITPVHLRGGDTVTSSEQDLISRYNKLESTRL